METSVCTWVGHRDRTWFLKEPNVPVPCPGTPPRHVPGCPAVSRRGGSLISQQEVLVV